MSETTFLRHRGRYVLQESMFAHIEGSNAYLVLRVGSVSLPIISVTDLGAGFLSVECLKEGDHKKYSLMKVDDT